MAVYKFTIEEQQKWELWLKEIDSDVKGNIFILQTYFAQVSKLSYWAYFYNQLQARPEDIVNLDLKSTLRVLYNLFTKYKHLS